MTARTPIERGAEGIRVLEEGYDFESGDFPTSEQTARAVFESIDREGLIAVLADHRDEYDSDCGVDYPCSCGAGKGENGYRDPEFNHAEHMVDAIRAWLLGEGGA